MLFCLVQSKVKRTVREKGQWGEKGTELSFYKRSNIGFLAYIEVRRNSEIKPQRKRLSFGSGLGLGFRLRRGLGWDQPSLQVLCFLALKCRFKIIFIKPLVFGSFKPPSPQERQIYLQKQWLASHWKWNNSWAICLSQCRRSQLCLVGSQINGARLKTWAPALCLLYFNLLISIPKYWKQNKKRKKQFMKSPAVKCLLLLGTHYSMCTSKHYIYGKANSSSFHFTAHQKLFGFFFFTRFIFQSSTSSCGHLSSPLFGDDQLINYSFCIDDFLLSAPVSITHFVCVLQQTDCTYWGQNKFFNNFKPHEGKLAKNKKKQPNIARPCYILGWRVRPLEL